MQAQLDPGSFKDPEGRVIVHRGEVYRTLTEDAARRMRASRETLEALCRDGRLIATRLVSRDEAGLPAGVGGETLLHHERVPVITYPFEWSFDMLREAALCTLEVLETCLERGLILKDASAYNVAFHRGRMVFIDTLSIDAYAEGEPWDGYAQFCREFLFPLMLTAYRGVEFQPWFRGRLNGLALADLARLLTWRDLLRKGVLRHVVLQRRLERWFAGADMEIRGRFRDIRFSKGMILANLRGLRKVVASLAYRAAESHWLDYTEKSSYSDEERAQKADFVGRALDRLAPAQVVDLGCNIGDHALIAAGRAAQVVAADLDPACVNTLYRRLGADDVRNVTPMVADLLNPSPGLGWDLRERSPLFDRIRSDAFLALALVHHVAIDGNVPLAAFLDRLSDIAPAGVVEWVDKQDGMVRRMLRNRTDVFPDYDWAHFERLLRERFTLAEVAESHQGQRKLCLVLPRDREPPSP
ncbi:MAG: hypothetical protein ACE5JZ_00300 [Kiloniellales bacterium]